MGSLKTIISKAIFIALLISGTGNFLPVHAQSTLTVESAIDSNMIKFTGMEGDMLVFDVQLADLPAKYSKLSILDGKENLVFEERITGASYTRRYKIERNDMDIVTFKITSGTVSRTQSFSINYRVEERVEVKKL